MADAAQAYYTTSYTFGNGTTSTAALMIWRALSTQLETKGLPMTTEELEKASGLSQKQLDAIFGQSYYQKYYGFRRFDSLEAWETWARETGVIYVAPPQPDPSELEDEDEEELDEDEE